jgi:hypothetical protein
MDNNYIKTLSLKEVRKIVKDIDLDKIFFDIISNHDILLENKIKPQQLLNNFSMIQDYSHHGKIVNLFVLDDKLLIKCKKSLDKEMFTFIFNKVLNVSEDEMKEIKELDYVYDDEIGYAVSSFNHEFKNIFLSLITYKYDNNLFCIKFKENKDLDKEVEKIKKIEEEYIKTNKKD